MKKNRIKVKIQDVQEEILKEVINEKEIRKIVMKTSVESLVRLYKWLYDNHKNILREYEKSQGFKYQIESA